METKEELIKYTIQQLLKVAKEYSRIEELPITVDEGIEITTAEAHTIQAVGEGKLVRVMDIANRFGISKSAASQMVAKLIKKGFLVKEQSPYNNKEYPLSLTETGKTAFNAHEKFHGKDMNDLIKHLDSFSLSQISTISVMLEAIVSIMEQRLAKKRKN